MLQPLVTKRRRNIGVDANVQIVKANTRIARIGICGFTDRDMLQRTPLDPREAASGIGVDATVSGGLESDDGRHLVHVTQNAFYHTTTR